MTTTAAAPAATKTRAKTRYHIFREIDNAGVKTYEPVDAHLEASSADNALQTWAAQNTADGKSGVYVAVAARRFTPKKITFDTKTIVKVS